MYKIQKLSKLKNNYYLTQDVRGKKTQNKTKESKMFFERKIK